MIVDDDSNEVLGARTPVRAAVGTQRATGFGGKGPFRPREPIFDSCCARGLGSHHRGQHDYCGDEGKDESDFSVYSDSKRTFFSDPDPDTTDE
jgi:hypothetical protein